MNMIYASFNSLKDYKWQNNHFKMTLVHIGLYDKSTIFDNLLHVSEDILAAAERIFSLLAIQLMNELCREISVRFLISVNESYQLSQSTPWIFHITNYKSKLLAIILDTGYWTNHCQSLQR